MKDDVDCLLKRHEIGILIAETEVEKQKLK